MAGADLRLDGFRELDELLGKLGHEGAARAMRASLKPAGEVIAAAAAQLAPKDEGLLGQAIEARLRRPKAGETGMTVSIGISKRAFRVRTRGGSSRSFVRATLATTYVDKKGKTRTRKRALDPSKLRFRGARREYPWVYGRFKEFGTRQRGATPFLRPALDAAGQTAVNVLGVKLMFNINREIARMAKRGTRGRR